MTQGIAGVLICPEGPEFLDADTFKFKNFKVKASLS